MPSENVNRDGACRLIDSRGCGGDREFAADNGTSEPGEVIEIKNNSQHPGKEGWLSTAVIGFTNPLEN